MLVTKIREHLDLIVANLTFLFISFCWIFNPDYFDHHGGLYALGEPFLIWYVIWLNKNFGKDKIINYALALMNMSAYIIWIVYELNRPTNWYGVW